MLNISPLVHIDTMGPDLICTNFESYVSLMPHAKYNCLVGVGSKAKDPNEATCVHVF